MKRMLAAACLIPLCASAAGPVYTADGKLVPPADYRQWIFLTSSLDMSYSLMGNVGMHMFDNVFVEPSAWASFQQTGTWPEQVVLVKEMRGVGGKSSINRHGSFQTSERMGIELHVKDGGNWSFYDSASGEPASRIPDAAACYSCHHDHGAVDNTFVQFYPTLLEIAEKKHTLSPGYLKEGGG